MKNNNNEDGYLDEMESIGSISCGGVCSLRYGIIPDMHCNCADSVP